MMKIHFGLSHSPHTVLKSVPRFSGTPRPSAAQQYSEPMKNQDSTYTFGMGSRDMLLIHVQNPLLPKQHQQLCALGQQLRPVFFETKKRNTLHGLSVLERVREGVEAVIQEDPLKDMAVLKFHETEVAILTALQQFGPAEVKLNHIIQVLTHAKESYNPSYWLGDTYLHRSSLYQNQGQMTKAEADLKHGVQQYEQTVHLKGKKADSLDYQLMDQARSQLVGFYENQGRPEEALALCEKITANIRSPQINPIGYFTGYLSTEHVLDHLQQHARLLGKTGKDAQAQNIDTYRSQLEQQYQEIYGDNE